MNSFKILLFILQKNMIFISLRLSAVNLNTKPYSLFMNPKPASFKLRKSLILFIVSLYSFSFSYSQNAIVTENKLAGNPSSEWDIANGTSGDPSIQGFATDMSVNKGGTINFKIDVNTGTNKQFGIKIYRNWEEHGKGARLRADLGTAFTGIAQNACGYDATTGLTD